MVFPMRLALAQINNTVGDLEANAAKILDFAAKPTKRGQMPSFSQNSPSLVTRRAIWSKNNPSSIAPPLSSNRHRAKRLSQNRPHPRLRRPLARTRRHSRAKRRRRYAAWRIVFKQVKMLLPNYDVFDEARYFLPGSSQELCHLCGEKVAIAICEDGWNDKQFWERRRYKRDPIEELAHKGAQLIVSINASPWNIGKRHEREDIFRATAKRFGLPLVYVHMVGGNDQLIFDGSSFAMSASGEVAASAKSFEEDLILFDTATGKGEDHSNHLTGDEAAYQALVLGTRDYIRKCGFRTCSSASAAASIPLSSPPSPSKPSARKT